MHSHCEVNGSEPSKTAGINVGRNCPLTDLMERMACISEEKDQVIDLQVVEDVVHSVLAFLDNAATQFLIYRTKILKKYNTDLVSFSEEMEPELRAAAPLLFGPSFTKQTVDHLGQVEKKRATIQKFFQGPPCKGRLVGRG